MQTDFTLVENKEEEDWWVVKVQLEVKKIILDGTLKIRMEICFKD